MPGPHMLAERAGQPCGKVAETVARRVPETLELQLLVAPNRLDQRRACAISTRSNVPDERSPFERHAAVHQRTDDEQPLARLQIQRNPDRQLAVMFESFVE